MTRSGILACGPGFSWQAYRFDDGTEGAACYLENLNGLRGLIRRDLRGWWCANHAGQRTPIPNNVIAELRGTHPNFDDGDLIYAEQTGLLGDAYRHLALVTDVA